MTSASASLSALTWFAHICAVWLVGLVVGWAVSAPPPGVGAAAEILNHNLEPRPRLRDLALTPLRPSAPPPQLPRPKWAKRGLDTRAALGASPLGAWLSPAFSHALVAWNASLVAREVWYRFQTPGTARALAREAWAALRARRAPRWPASAGAGKGEFEPLEPLEPLARDALPGWPVAAAELELFRDAVERGAGPAWEPLLTRAYPGVTYSAWRRWLPSGRTEYKSTTVVEDATPTEAMDFYLDDAGRPRWDAMITATALVEAAHAPAHRCQVVRWVRSFPFAFLSAREYVIARRVFAGAPTPAGPTLYAVTRSVEHAAAPRAEGLVRMEAFYSIWRSAAVPCPRGSGRPATETTLLHFEDFGVPEHLARFAVRHGMPGFVSKVPAAMRAYVDARRAGGAPAPPPAPPPLPPRAAPAAPASGGSPPWPPALSRAPSAASVASFAASDASASSSFLDDSASERSGRVPRAPSMRSLGYMLLASGVAIALSRSASAPGLAAAAEEEASSAAPKRSPRSRHGHAGQLSLAALRQRHGKRHGHGHGHGHGPRAGRAAGGEGAAAAPLPPAHRRAHPAPERA
jgi:hypothetical protein